MMKFKKLSVDSIDDYMNISLSNQTKKEPSDSGYLNVMRKNILAGITDSYDVSYIGVYDGAQMVATMKIVDLAINLFGKMQQATGLMAMSVRPEYVKYDTIKEIIAYLEGFAESLDSNISMIFPCDIEISDTLGYGEGSRMERYNVNVGSLPKSDDIAKLRFLGNEDLWETLKYHENFARNNHGIMMKSVDEISDMQHDANLHKIGYVINSHIKGYLTYKFETYDDMVKHIEVEEMVYENKEILKCLLGFLKIYSNNARYANICTDEEDFFRLLDIDVKNSTQTDLAARAYSSGIMGKVISPVRFITETRYRRLPLSDMTLGLEYEDNETGGKKLVKIDIVEDLTNGCSRWKVAKTNKRVDVVISCTEAAMSSLLLGMTHLTKLIRNGSASISDENFTIMLDTIFYGGSNRNDTVASLNE